MEPIKDPRLSGPPVWVYRLHDKSGEVIYVGIARDIKRRLNAHRFGERKPWFHKVARVTADEYPNERAARMAEIEAIRALLPRHNHCEIAKAERARRGLTDPRFDSFPLQPSTRPVSEKDIEKHQEQIAEWQTERDALLGKDVCTNSDDERMGRYGALNPRFHRIHFQWGVWDYATTSFVTTGYETAEPAAMVAAEMNCNDLRRLLMEARAAGAQEGEVA